MYLNQIGGQDELVFDGGSFVMNPDRNLAWQLPAWREDLAITYWHRSGNTWKCQLGKTCNIEKDLAAIYQAMTVGLRDYVNKNGFPGQALACELYITGGVRCSEIGSLMFGGIDENGKEYFSDNELVRLAMPRRTYTQSHIDYVIEVIIDVYKRRKNIRGLKIIEQSKYLRHFTAKLKKV